MRACHASSSRPSNTSASALMVCIMARLLRSPRRANAAAASPAIGGTPSQSFSAMRQTASSGLVDGCHGIVQQPFARGAQEAVADVAGHAQFAIGCGHVASREYLAPLPEELGLGPCAGLLRVALHHRVGDRHVAVLQTWQ